MGRGVNDKYFGSEDGANPVFEVWCKLDGYEGNAWILNQVDKSVFFVQMQGDPSITGYVKLQNDLPWENGYAFMWWYTENRSGVVVEMHGQEFVGVNWDGPEGYIKMPYSIYYDEAERSNDAIAYISSNSWD